MLIISWGIIAAVVAGLAWFFGSQAGGEILWLTDIMVLPLAGGLIIMALPDRHARFIKWIAATFAFAALALSVVVVFKYRQDGGAGYQFLERTPWIPSLGISYQLGVDGIATAMLLLTGVIIFCGCLASWGVEHRAKEFFALLLVLVTGVFGVFAAQDLFLFF
ncbi:MAG: hypothetical protein AAB368_02005, partial [bacterium]